MSKKKWIIFLLFLGAMNIALFWPWSLYFLNDDFVHIPLTDAGKLFQNNSIRPLHELLVRFDLMLYGKQAFGFHITALLLHFIVCFQLFDLCFVIQTRWLQTNKETSMNAAFIATALFLIYPQYSESLAWILGRTPTLSAIFLLPVLRLFFTKKITAFTCFTGFLLFNATQFTYEQSILLPVALFGLAFIEKDNASKHAKYLYTASISLAAIVYVIARKMITDDIVGTYEGNNFITFDITHLAGNFFRLVTRLWLNPASVNTYMICVGASIIVLSILLHKTWKQLIRNKNTVLFFVGIILLMIVPVISLGITIRSYESGRYLYLPSIFFVMALGIFLGRFFVEKNHLKKYILPVIALFVCYWGFGKYQSANQYKKASAYVLKTQELVITEAMNTQNNISLDTLRLTIYRIPVFRVGFNSGLKWINPDLDTNRVAVKYFYDEFTDPTLK